MGSKTIARIRLTLSVAVVTLLVTYMNRDDYQFNPWVTLALGAFAVDTLYNLVRAVVAEVMG
jgi:hypothetical protein